jgi:RNA polymerase sigma-70 factor (ECF subfamily)
MAASPVIAINHWMNCMTETSKATRFELLVMPHLDAAFNLARWLTHDSRDAEDVVQEAYLRAYQFFDSFHGEDGRSWMLAIVRNTFYSEYRRKQGRAQDRPFDENAGEQQAGSNGDDSSEPEAALQRKDEARSVNRALAGLPVEFREVLVLRELEDMSYRQIAVIVGVPMGTVMSRLSRARKLLSEQLLPLEIVGKKS